jgi:hypothetical protein
MKPTCNCIEEINKELSEKLGKKCCLNYDLLSGGIFINFTYDETTRTGKTRQKTGYIMPTSCPFCGKPYKKEEEK